MAKRTHLIAAACVATAAGLFSAGSLIAQNNLAHDAQVAPESFMLPTGITAKEFNSDKGIEKAFQSLANYSIDKTGFDNIVSGLVDQDRDRIKKSLPSGRSLSNVMGDDNKQLKDLVADIQSNWKTKYSHKFDLNYKDAYSGGFIQAITGEVTDPSQLLGKWPLDAGRSPGPAAGKFNQADLGEDQKNFGGSVNLEKDRHVAIARLTGLNETGPLTASLIHEAGGWKFDIPNTMNAEQLYNNLTNSLSYIDQHKTDWPADENEAYRHLTDAVTAALYDVSLTGRNGTAMER